jgi:sugar phosphate isomerase/epimerase
MAIACSTSIKCGSPLETALSEIQRLGIPKVDLLTIGTWAHVNVIDFAADVDGTIDRVEALVRRHGLTPVAMNTGTSVPLHDRSPEAGARRRAEVAAFVAMMKRFGVKVAAIQPLGRDRKRPGEDVLRDCAATLREQLDTAAAAGVAFAVELHVNSPFESVAEAKRLIELLPDVPLVYDPTHFVMQGTDVRETGWLMDRATHAHLRDAARGKLQAPLGEGDVDFDWVLGALKDRGFAGNISIEYLETTDFDASDSARRLYDRIAKDFPA